MRFNRPSIHSFRIPLLLIIAGAATLVALAMRYSPHTKSRSTVIASSPSKTAETNIANASEPRVLALPIQLKFGGFVPMEITRPAGDYLFSVVNQSGTPEIFLRLDRERGARLHEAALKKERLRWRKTVHLTPGVYLLTEANHPRWVCRITITPR